MSKPQPSNTQKEFIARLMAVQACYQVSQNERPIRIVMQEFLDDGLQTDEEGEQEPPEDIASIKIRPHGGLFNKILLSLEENRASIEGVIVKLLSKDDENQKVEDMTSLEPLLKAILLCGICDIMINTKTDAPIIINDYINVTHEFYPKQQAALVNGVLDSAAKALR